MAGSDIEIIERLDGWHVLCGNDEAVFPRIRLVGFHLAISKHMNHVYLTHFRGVWVVTWGGMRPDHSDAVSAIHLEHQRYLFHDRTEEYRPYRPPYVQQRPSATISP